MPLDDGVQRAPLGISASGRMAIEALLVEVVEDDLVAGGAELLRPAAAAMAWQKLPCRWCARMTRMFIVHKGLGIGD